MNNAGQVAGIESLAAFDASNLFVRTPTPGNLSTATFLIIPISRDLQGFVNPFAGIIQVLGINDQQFILARGFFDPTGKRNFGPTQVEILLTPSFNAPEPGTLGAALTGAVLTGLYLNKRRSRGGRPAAPHPV